MRNKGSGPVGRILFAGKAGMTVIPLGDRLPGRSSHLPARSGGPPCRSRGPIACLFGVAPDGVWRAVRVATNAVSSYLAVSPLPDSPTRMHHRCNRLRNHRVSKRFVRLRRFVFCATFRRLGPFGLLRLAVSQHPAQWSPDLPPEATGYPVAASDRPARFRIHCIRDTPKAVHRRAFARTGPAA